MDWFAEIDAYCERLGPEYWSEPLNAISNGAFLLAALFMWRRTRGQGIPAAALLCALLALIGVGSFLFHTHAEAWSALADTLPITAFILCYIYLMNRDFLGWRPWVAALGTLGYLPYAGAVTPVLDALPFFRISDFYWTVPILIGVYVIAMRTRAPDTARGLAIGATLLSVSITVRSADLPLCQALPMGTHFVWHCLNGVMLGWMIAVYHRHMLALRAVGR